MIRTFEAMCLPGERFEAQQKFADAELRMSACYDRIRDGDDLPPNHVPAAMSGGCPPLGRAGGVHAPGNGAQRARRTEAANTATGLDAKAAERRAKRQSDEGVNAE